MPLSLMPRTTGRRKDPQPLLQRDGVQNAQGRHLYAAFGHFELRVGPLLHFGRLHPVLRLPLLRAIRPSRPGRRLARDPRGQPTERDAGSRTWLHTCSIPPAQRRSLQPPPPPASSASVSRSGRFGCLLWWKPAQRLNTVCYLPFIEIVDRPLDLYDIIVI